MYFPKKSSNYVILLSFVQCSGHTLISAMSDTVVSLTTSEYKNINYISTVLTDSGIQSPSTDWEELL